MSEPAEIAAHIETHVAAGRLAEAVQQLRVWTVQAAPAFADDATALAAEASALRAAERRDELSADERSRSRRRLASRILALKRDIAEGLAAKAGPVAPLLLSTRSSVGAAPIVRPIAPSVAPAGLGQHPVFISYNHQDADSAAVVRHALLAAGIDVLIDSLAMAPGEDIGHFVRRCIAASRATVCLVSRHSLLSGWVAQETLLALSVQALDDGAAAASALERGGLVPTPRAFVALFLDEDFFAPAVRLKLTETIDTRLAELDKLRVQHAQHKLDSVDLDAEAARLHALRHGLGAVLQKLRQTLCMDLREPARAASLARVVQHLARAEPGASAPTRHG